MGNDVIFYKVSLCVITPVMSWETFGMLCFILDFTSFPQKVGPMVSTVFDFKDQVVDASRHFWEIFIGLLKDFWEGIARRLYSYVLRWESSLCKTPHFQWIYGKLNQIYEKLRSDQMDPNSVLGGPKPIARTGRSLLKN